MEIKGRYLRSLNLPEEAIKHKINESIKAIVTGRKALSYGVDYYIDVSNSEYTLYAALIREFPEIYSFYGISVVDEIIKYNGTYVFSSVAVER